MAPRGVVLGPNQMAVSHRTRSNRQNFCPQKAEIEAEAYLKMRLPELRLYVGRIK